MNYAQIRRTEQTPSAQGTSVDTALETTTKLSVDALPPYMASVGKQTVAEAASTRGAPLEMYAGECSPMQRDTMC